MFPLLLQIRGLDAATNVGPAELLDLHNEMCYNPKPNRKIILICLKPAEEVRQGQDLVTTVLTLYNTAYYVAQPGHML